MMKTAKIRLIIIFSVVITLSILVTFFGSSFYYKNQIKFLESNTQSQLNNLQIQISELESSLSQKEQIIQEKENQIADKEQELSNTKKFFERYIKASHNFDLAASNLAIGDYYYKLASYAYEDAEAPWQWIIDYCVEARTYYSTASQYYKNAEELFKKTKESAPDDTWGELIDNYILLMSSGSRIADLMYEACEYFESAALKYSYWAIYYDDSYGVEGDRYIDKMNEKIAAHDNEVKRFNQYLAKINAVFETMDN